MTPKNYEQLRSLLGELLIRNRRATSDVKFTKRYAKTIRYQLLHRTASAIIEARRFNAAHAVMMVHSFSQTHEWFDDYNKFLGLFNLRGAPNLISSMSMSNLELHFAWIQGEEPYLSI